MKIVSESHRSTRVKLSSKDLRVRIPSGFLMGGAVYETRKHIEFLIQWFKEHYRDYKRKCNLRSFSGQANGRHENSPHVGSANVPDFEFTLSCQLLQLTAEERKLALLYVWRNEILGELENRDIFNCASRVLLALLKKLKDDTNLDRLVELEFEELEYEVVVPRELRDKDNCFQEVKRLDEAAGLIKPEMFEKISASRNRMRSSSMKVSCRNLKVPVMEVRDLDFGFLLLHADPSRRDDSPFALNIRENVFGTHFLIKRAHRLDVKLMYDATMSAE